MTLACQMFGARIAPCVQVQPGQSGAAGKIGSISHEICRLTNYANSQDHCRFKAQTECTANPNRILCDAVIYLANAKSNTRKGCSKAQLSAIPQNNAAAGIGDRIHKALAEFIALPKRCRAHDNSRSGSWRLRVVRIPAAVRYLCPASREPRFPKGPRSLPSCGREPRASSRPC